MTVTAADVKALRDRTGAAMMDIIRRSTANCDVLCNMTILLWTVR